MLTVQNGFGVNTYRFVTDEGESKLIKWHFTTRQGLASLVWEEAQILAGRNPDYHRQDLWDAIEAGNGPEWDVAVQIVNEEDAEAYGFDMLDATKLLPQELVPLQTLGVLKLDTNPTNYFAETEQIMVSSVRVSQMAVKLTDSVPTRTHSSRHRLQRGPSAAGPHLFVPRHAAQPQPRQPQL